MTRAHPLPAILTLGTLLLSCSRVASAEEPQVGYRVNAPGWITVYWEHPGDTDTFHVQREQTPTPYTWVFKTHVGSHTDMGLAPDTVYRYRVCALYGTSPECSEWFEARTMAAQPPAPPVYRDPPSVLSHESFHEPSRIRLTWRKNGNYSLVLLRWRHKTSGGDAQVDVKMNGPTISYEVPTPTPGTYVFILKGCNRNILGSTNCGEWSAPVEVDTAPTGVAHVNCIPGTLKPGSARFAANGRAEYRFTPKDDATAGVCLRSDRIVMANYDVQASWNPAARPTQWDTSGANASETVVLTFGEDFSPERAPRRPLQPGESPVTSISFLVRARCDRDPWLNPGAACQRTGHNMPQDIQAKWPTLLTQPFPHSRHSIPAPELARLRTSFNMVTGTLVAPAKPTINPKLLTPKGK